MPLSGRTLPTACILHSDACTLLLIRRAQVLNLEPHAALTKWHASMTSQGVQKPRATPIPPGPTALTH